jgi:hypothetical protein
MALSAERPRQRIEPEGKAMGGSPLGASLGAAWVQKGGNLAESGPVIAGVLSRSQTRPLFPLFSMGTQPPRRECPGS